MSVPLNPYQIIKNLETISGSKDKVAFMRQNESGLFKNILKGACDPFITYGVKQFSFHEFPAKHEDFVYNFKCADILLTELSRRNLTGNAAQQAIIKASKYLNEEQLDILTRILDKDLKCGVSVATVNQAFPGLIQVWKMQKANKVNYDKIVYPCLAEVKENGRGNTAIVNGLEVKHYSNEGNENSNMNVFDKELIGIADGLPVVFFGEVRGSKGTGVEQFKQSQSLGGHNADMTDMVFVLWDMLLLGEFKRHTCPRDQKTRSMRLRDHLRSYQINHDQDAMFKVRLVHGKHVESEHELTKFARQVMKEGREGLIVKRLDAVYQFSRNDNWMKIKESHTLDLKIVDIKEGKGILSDTLGSVTVLNGKVKVDCPMGKGVNREEASEMWRKYKKDPKTLIGKIAEISFQNVTPDGSLFLPKFLRVRTGEKSVSDK